MLCPDGSMGLAGDDLDELLRRAEAMATQTRLVIERVPTSPARAEDHVESASATPQAHAEDP